LIIALSGWVASWVIGMFVGAKVGTLYERSMHPHNPDPVNVDVAIVFLLVWVVIGLVGSAWFSAGAVRAGRRVAGRELKADR